MNSKFKGDSLSNSERKSKASFLFFWRDFFLFVKQILRSWKKTNNTVEPELIKNENVTTIYYDGILVTKKSIPNSVYTKTEIQ